MGNARSSYRLQAGDVFRFADGMIIELQSNNGRTQRRYADPHQEYVVLRAYSTTGGDRMGHHGDNGGWAVWAVPKGTALEDIRICSLTFNQEGPYQAYALVQTVLVEAATPIEHRLHAVSA
ncbi:MAG: hypothetical protein DI537_10675 [Stutzerimonas stutzeri]|nr:MAG: hypothetical protein DI537_10675 [Stutzerimonas stutzeri]